MKKRILSFALVLMLMLSIVPFSAFARESTDFALTGGEVTVDGTADKTVNVAFVANSAVTVIALQGSFAETSDYLTLTDSVSPVALTGTNYFDTASGAFVYADAALEGYSVAAGGNVMTAVYTVDKNTPAGTYEVTLNLKTVQDYDFVEVKNQTYTATITVTNNSTPDEPGESEYTLTISDGIDGTAEVKVGTKVTMTVSVTGNTANGVDAVVTYNPAVFSYAEDTAKTGKIAITELNKAGVTGTIKTLEFTAIAEGTGVFGFDSSAMNTAGNFANFKVADAVKATLVGDSVKVYNTYSVTVEANEHATTLAATPNTDVKEGTVVTLTAEAKNGYEFESWNVTCNGAPVTVTSNQFKMPKGNVHVKATFKEIEVDQFTVNVTEYIAGVSLVTVNGTNEFGYAYNGQAMYKVAAYGDVYAFLVAGNADAALVTVREAGAVEVITAGCDVNGTGKVDFNDAGAAFGCYNGAYDVVANMAMFLRADVNGDKIVDAADVNAVLAAY